MNLTILHLVMLNNYQPKSAVFSTSSKINSLTLEKSLFSKSLGSVIFSNNVRLNVHESTFQKFSSSPIILAGTNFFNETIETRSSNIYVGPANITDCIFKMCFGYDLNGGAIYSITSLNIHHCVFFHNSAKKGGSIYCKGNFTVSYSSFLEGFSIVQGGAIYNEGSSVFNVSFTEFANLNSKEYGCFVKKSSCDSFIEFLNITMVYAQQKNGGFCIVGGSSTIHRCDIQKSYAFSSSSILLKSSSDSKIERCSFFVTGAETYGSVFAIEESKCTIQFDHCTITACKIGTKYINAEDDSKIIISNLCTTDDPKDVVGNGAVFSTKPTVQTQCNIWEIEKQIGYFTQNYRAKNTALKRDLKMGVAIGVMCVIPMVCGILVAMFVLSQLVLLYQKIQDLIAKHRQ